MSRTACAWIPQFELNARLALEPELAGEALIIADAGSARATVIDASREAMLCGVRSLMSMVTARALCPETTIIPPDPAFVRAQSKRVLAVLYQLAPVVGRDGQGAFFLDLGGLARLHPDERALIRCIRQAVATLSLPVVVAIADRPTSAWIAARCGVDESIVPPGGDLEFLAQLPAAAIPMPEQVARLCRLLGLETVADLQRLPAGALCRRFGKLGAELQQRIFARSEEIYRIELPEHVEEVEIDLDDPSADGEVLLFLHKSAIDRLIKEVAAARRSVAALEVILSLTDGESTRVRNVIRPARPTNNARVLLELVALWLAGLDLSAEVDTLRVRAPEVCVVSPGQLSLFEREEARGGEALALAIARLVAAFGKEAVVQPRLADRHLPEARLSWEPVIAASLDPVASRQAGLSSRGAKAPARASTLPLPVVRLLDPPRPVWLHDGRLRVGEQGQRTRIVHREGPYRIEGEWWQEPGFSRRYLLVVTEEKEVCWLYQDARQRQWYLQGYLD